MDLKDLRTGFFGLENRILSEEAWAWLPAVLGQLRTTNAVQAASITMLLHMFKSRRPA